MKTSKDQIVGYVRADGTVTKAKVLEVVAEDGDGSVVRLDHTAKDTKAKTEEFGGAHISQAHYSAGKKTPNTWHQLEAGHGSSPNGAEKKAG